MTVLVRAYMANAIVARRIRMMTNRLRSWKDVGIAVAALLLNAVIVLHLLGVGGAQSSLALPFVPYPDGQTCVQNSECASTFCTDGVCCHTICNDPFQTCNQAGFVGTCTRRQTAPAVSWQVQLVMVGLLFVLAWRRLSTRANK